MRRRGFTFFEIVVALGMLAIAIVLTAQLSYHALRERMRNDFRQAAVETVSNTLETARALPWAALTAEWAAAQHVPESWKETQQDAELKVRVEPEAATPNLKRVTVTVRWDFREGIPPQELQLVTLLAPREAVVMRSKP
jgi:Tfp pilus assembly protein PilE